MKIEANIFRNILHYTFTISFLRLNIILLFTHSFCLILRHTPTYVSKSKVSGFKLSCVLA